MSKRLKLPAYAKPLLAMRRAGKHPETVQVIVGDDWRTEEGRWPVLALKLADWAPGRYDWSACAGLRVVVVDRAFEDWQALAQLAAEIARVAAPVMVVSPWCAAGCAEVTEIAWLARAQSRGQRPVWWDEEIQRDYDIRWGRYHQQFVA